MTTARFLVTLTRSANTLCRARRDVRRNDEDRAVLYTQLWLLRTQPLAKLFGVTFDMYEVFKKNEDGNWTLVATGDVNDAKAGRQHAQTQSKTNPPTTPKAARPTKPKSATKSTRLDELQDYQQKSRRVTAGRTPESHTKQSILQSRIAEAKAKARRIIKEKRARGEQ